MPVAANSRYRAYNLALFGEEKLSLAIKLLAAATLYLGTFM